MTSAVALPDWSTNRSSLSVYAAFIAAALGFGAVIQYSPTATPTPTPTTTATTTPTATATATTTTTTTPTVCGLRATERDSCYLTALGRSCGHVLASMMPPRGTITSHSSG